MAACMITAIEHVNTLDVSSCNVQQRLLIYCVSCVCCSTVRDVLFLQCQRYSSTPAQVLLQLQLLALLQRYTTAQNHQQQLTLTTTAATGSATISAIRKNCSTHLSRKGM